MVARFVRDEEAAGSNPVIPTINRKWQSPAEKSAGDFSYVELKFIFDFFVTDKADEHIRSNDFIIELNQGFVHMDGDETAIMLILDFISELFFVVFLEGFGGTFAGGYVEDTGVNIFLALAILEFEDDIDGNVLDHL